jgi:uncharacterized protein (TIGR03435 family)
MHRLVVWALGVFPLLAQLPPGVSPDRRFEVASVKPAQFEVATIKPHDPNVPGFGIAIKGRRFTGVNVSVSSLMAFAYTLHPRQIVDAPGWIESERFDIVAEAAEGDSTSMKLLVQGLLTDRFHLAFHRTQKELAVLELLPAKSGPKLAGHPGDPNGKGTFGFHALGTMEVRDATMADFVGWMQRYVVDRPVVDRTGAAGHYTFKLTWKSDEFQFTPIARALPVDPANNELPDLYTALEQQLGLKLRSTKAPVEVFAVDRLDKPTPD